MNAPMIKPNGCKNCRYRAFANGVSECHFGPPTAHPIVEQDSAGKMRIIGTMSLFPNVQPDWICGQHKPLSISLGGRPLYEHNVSTVAVVKGLGR